MLGLAQAACHQMLSVDLLVRPGEDRPANITSDEEEEAERHAGQGESDEKQSRRRFVMEGGNKRAIEIVVKERREILQPTSIDLAPGDIQEQGEKKQTACPTCCSAATDSKLRNQQGQHAKEEDKQAQIHARQ